MGQSKRTTEGRRQPPSNLPSSLMKHLPRRHRPRSGFVVSLRAVLHRRASATAEGGRDAVWSTQGGARNSKWASGTPRRVVIAGLQPSRVPMTGRAASGGCLQQQPACHLLLGILKKRFIAIPTTVNHKFMVRGDRRPHAPASAARHLPVSALFFLRNTPARDSPWRSCRKSSSACALLRDSPSFSSRTRSTLDRQRRHRLARPWDEPCLSQPITPVQCPDRSVALHYNFDRDLHTGGPH